MPPRNAQADKFMALAKESETFDEYSIEKRGSCVRLEKQIGQFQCSFCSEETDFYDVRFEDTHWSVVPRQNMSPSGRRMTAEEVEEMERLQAAVTHLKVSAVWKSVRSPHAIDATQVKFDLINKGQVSKAKSTRNATAAPARGSRCAWRRSRSGAGRHRHRRRAHTWTRSTMTRTRMTTMTIERSRFHLDLRHVRSCLR